MADAAVKDEDAQAEIKQLRATNNEAQQWRNSGWLPLSSAKKTRTPKSKDSPLR